MHTVWQLYQLISQRLLRWSALSVFCGIVLILLGGTYIFDLPFLRGFGIQAIGWGLLDAAIAQGGQWLVERRRGGQSETENDQEEAHKLRRLLLVNTALDVFYVCGGLILAYRLGAQDPAWRGHGWGIVVQGAFLFFFDMFHARRVPVGVPQDSADLYRGRPEHEAFAFPAAELPAAGETAAEAKGPAALLVHGYLGTPEEVRALGVAISEKGWAARGPLLPGFGTDIETLPERHFEDWLAVLEEELSALQAQHHPVLLVGYSMGGALALCLAARRMAAQGAAHGAAHGAAPPDGLVLLAPFTQAAPGPLEALWGGVRRLLPFVRPMRWINLDQPHLRHAMRGLMPDADLDDPAVQRRLRQIAVPTDIVTGLIECSGAVRRECRPLSLPTLVVQGEHDEIVRSRYTRRLVQCLGPSVRYEEIDANHGLVYPVEPSWPEVERIVLAFADEIHKGSE